MKVLVGIDESEYSGDAIRFIGDVPWPEATQFIVLSTSSPIVFGAGDGLPAEQFTDMLRREEEHHREIAERAALRLRKAGLSARARTARAPAQIALVDTARSENADLVVVGSHGRSGFKKLLLGSVASHVVTHAPCSVLVVKQPQLHGRALEPAGREEKEKAMKVEQLMTREVETCTPETDLAHAAMIMSRRNCGLVPVVDHKSGQLAGVITDRDICMAAAMRRVDAHSIPVGEVMTSRLVTCAPTDEAEVAMHKMSEARVRRLPVVDKTGALKGIVSLTDLALVCGPSSLQTGRCAVRDTDVLGVLQAVSEYSRPENPVSVS